MTEAEAIEQIDIGGPSMVRSAAKNMNAVAVITSPDQYDRVGVELDQHRGGTSLSLRRWLAAAAFARTAAYDSAIAAWMFARNSGSSAPDDQQLLPASLVLRYQKLSDLRYGENPHQPGAAYLDPTVTELSILQAHQLHGKELSFCNLYDADGALELIKEFDPDEQAAAAIIKHANPCGLSVADSLATAFTRAYEGDPLAAYGGIVCLNRPIDAATAEEITAIKSFFDVILAPGFSADALELLKNRWKNTRLLRLPASPTRGRRTEARDLKFIRGGLLIHQRDQAAMRAAQWTHAAGPEPDAQTLADLQLAMIAAKHLKSNAVSMVRAGMLVGAGAGQMDRVASCRIATQKAGERATGAVAGSDAFFPFSDGPQLLIEAGVRAIAHPGGSIRDQETQQLCQERNVTLLTTGTRHFRH
ncbi:MAG: bifunctional phosphoribosylaminoimidazolecarboxamide formyltransferase/IMP cyclohydrolase [Phycisphaeraceae bacterium]|nr:bifunctional phosphoribosylaminoimidazolecarboxamide formyltransferase/IMP cyclohydrolase [Phycisphaeraceae bacterium]